MLFPRIPSRPVRYALIATHAFRDAISDVEVDFTKAEQAIADRLDALTTKVDALLDKLAEYEESTNNGTEATEEVSKPKAKTKQRASRAKKK